MGVYIDIERKG